VQTSTKEIKEKKEVKERKITRGSRRELFNRRGAENAEKRRRYPTLKED
jgi:hypothetical protein